MQLKYKIGAGIATAALLGSSFIPTVFADNEISGNGDGSYNKIKITNNCTQTLSQSNVSTVVNNVSSNASTGGNNANGNTGGDVLVDTGNATSTVTITNYGSSNSATVSPCCCDQHQGESINLISGNGENSTNKIKLNSSKNSSVGQSNVTSLRNRVRSKAKTGKNNANGNTDGSTTVLTGDATSDITVTNTTPSNTLNP